MGYADSVALKEILMDVAEQLLDRAIAAGAQVAEVFQSGSLSRPIIFEGNRLKQVETTEAEGLALRLWQDGKPGLAVGYGPVDLQVLVEKALATSELNEPETPELTAGNKKDFGAVGEEMPVTAMVTAGTEAIARIRDCFPEAVCEAELSCDVETTRLINSTGLDYRYQDTTVSGYIDAAFTRLDDFLNVGDGLTARQPIEMTVIADSIIQRLSWAQQIVAPVTGQVPVIFTPSAASLLWDTLRAALNGKRILEGSSPWQTQWKQQVVDRAIMLRQVPTEGPYSCPFDDEGTPTQPLTLIENGQIVGIYCDRTTSKRAQQLPTPLAGMPQQSTGNGIRPGMGSYPTPGLINCVVTPGTQSWNSLIAQQKTAIVVDQVMGEGGDITGNLSINLELGYLVSEGEIVGRVKDTMVAGNAYDALNHLIALGSDADWSGSTLTPSVVVDGLTVTG